MIFECKIYIGFTLVVGARDAEGVLDVLRRARSGARRIGTIKRGRKGVQFED